MMMTRYAIPLAVAVFVLAGCGEITPTKFYTLTPAATEKAEPAAAESDISVGISPVILAEYLDRPQVVTRLGANRMDLENFDNWVEPLEAIIRRVVARDIGTILDSERVVSIPQERFIPIDYRVDIVVNRFDSGPEEDATLEARWAVVDDRSGDLSATNQSVFSEPLAENASTDDRVAAMSTLLGRLSREIATALAMADEG